MPIEVEEDSEWGVQYIELTKDISSTNSCFTIKPLHSCSLPYSRQHFPHTTASLNFTYVLLERVFCTYCRTFFHPTTSYMQEATRETVARQLNQKQ